MEKELRDLNRNMIAFDLILGSSALLAPTTTLKVLGHEEPSEDAVRSGSPSPRRTWWRTGAAAPATGGL
jgi:hypothetical protein